MKIKILGVDIPAKKAIWCSLSYIYGIGPALAKKICLDSKIDYNEKLCNLSEDNLDFIRKYIEEKLVIEGDLKRDIQKNIKRLIAIRSYKGLRHKLGLPVHGQRTKTNARTRKGKRKSVSSLNKK